MVVYPCFLSWRKDHYSPEKTAAFQERIIQSDPDLFSVDLPLPVKNPDEWLGPDLMKWIMLPLHLSLIHI